MKTVTGLAAFALLTCLLAAGFRPDRDPKADEPPAPAPRPAEATADHIVAVLKAKGVVTGAERLSPGSYRLTGADGESSCVLLVAGLDDIESVQQLEEIFRTTGAHRCACISFSPDPDRGTEETNMKLVKDVQAAYGFSPGS